VTSYFTSKEDKIQVLKMCDICVAISRDKSVEMDVKGIAMS